MKFSIKVIHIIDNMSIFENISQLSKRGLLDVPTPEPKYQIVQFPEEFVKIEDTERVFGISPNTIEEQVRKLIC